MAWKTASETENAGATVFAAARAQLRQRLGASSRLAVAFSGGVDSAALLHLAIDELGGENVLALHARSILFPLGRERLICDRMLADFSRRCQVRQVNFAPLTIPGFAENPPDRCYLCKKRMYGEFLRVARDFDAFFLADGANADDNMPARPGWRAIQELKVITPLREAGIGKAAIRAYARRHGLMNHDLPSQSCLATRFAPGLPIDEATLHLVAWLEARIGQGLSHDFRLRLSADGWGIEVRGYETENPDFPDEAAIRRCFREHGVELTQLEVSRPEKNALAPEETNKLLALHTLVR